MFSIRVRVSRPSFNFLGCSLYLEFSPFLTCLYFGVCEAIRLVRFGYNTFTECVVLRVAPVPPFSFSACAHSALHQADNLAKLRRDVLSVFELIAQILCAVSKAINRARLLAIRIYAIAITSATIFAYSSSFTSSLCLHP
mgnify:CR=1 FL=1